MKGKGKVRMLEFGENDVTDVTSTGSVRVQEHRLLEGQKTDQRGGEIHLVDSSAMQSEEILAIDERETRSLMLSGEV